MDTPRPTPQAAIRFAFRTAERRIAWHAAQARRDRQLRTERPTRAA